MSSPYPKYYKIILNSSNARYTNGSFTFDVNLPLFDSMHNRCEWVMNLSNFCSSVDPLSGLFIGQDNLSSVPIVNIHIQEFSQITQYSSKTKGMSDVIATLYNSSSEYFNTVNTIAIPIPEQWWINKTCTISFSDIQLNKLNVSQETPFQLTLDLWKADK